VPLIPEVLFWNRWRKKARFSLEKYSKRRRRFNVPVDA